jgi:hypothetical protein
MRCNLAVFFFGPGLLEMTLPLFADQQRVEVTSTERIDFAPWGMIRVNGPTAL